MDKSANLIVEKIYFTPPDATLDKLGENVESLRIGIYAKIITTIQKQNLVKGGFNISEENTTYLFSYTDYFMNNGFAQWGMAYTKDNIGGFQMIKLFARDEKEMGHLEVEVGRYSEQ